jgi:hypothetical protein
LNFDHIRENAKSEKMGFPLHFFLDAFNETFYKSCKKDFDNFFIQHKNVGKWLVFSDYALYDKSKKKDVITFSIVPYILNFDEFSDLLKNLSSNDLKKSRKVSEQFIEFIKNGPVFNISVNLGRNRRLHSDEKFYHESRFSMMIEMLEYWCITTPEGKENYIELIKKIAHLKDIVKNPGSNLKVIRDIEILSSLASYIMFEITKVIPVELIGWFSDRDSLLSYKAGKFKSPIIFDFISLLYYLFCENESVHTKSKLVLGVPESDSDGKLWYDGFNRIPDLIAGTYADYDSINQVSTHKKFIPVIEQLFTQSSKNLFFDVKFSKGHYSVERSIWETKV